MQNVFKCALLFADRSALACRFSFDGEALHVQPENFPTTGTHAAEKYFEIIEQGMKTFTRQEQKYLRALFGLPGPFPFAGDPLPVERSFAALDEAENFS